MGAFADTYGANAFDWQNGIGSTIGIQRSNLPDITAISDPVVSGRKAAGVSITPSERFTLAPGGISQVELIFQKPLKLTRGKDYLLRLSTFIPSTFPFGSNQAIAQIHQGTSSRSLLIAVSFVGSNPTTGNQAVKGRK